MTLPLLTRLRWIPDPVAGPRETAAVMARSFAYLYGAGASLILLTLLLPQSGHREPWAIVAVAAVAYVVVAVLLVRFDRLPGWVFLTMPPWGAVLVTCVVLAGGVPSVVAYATIYFWVVLSAHYFFPPRVGAANTAFVAVLYAAVLFVMPGVRDPQIKWLTLTSTLAVGGLLVSLLRDRVRLLFLRLQGHAERSDALARFSRQAIEPDRGADLAGEAVELLCARFDVDCANVLMLNDDERSLHVVAAAGWRQSIVGAAGIPVGPASLTGHALGSGEPVFADDHPDLTRSPGLATEGILSTVLVPLRGRDEIHGLLAVHARRAGAFGPAEAAEFEAVAAVVAGALDRDRSADRLRHQAYHDDLTGLPNRHLFLDRLDGALARAAEQGTTAAVLFLDLDNFKVLNDTLGHAAGDGVLVALMPRLRKTLFLSDTIARFGGDAFVVLCEGVDGERGAVEIAERLRATLLEPFAIGAAVHRLTASIGIALAPAGDCSPESLLRDADAALSRAKEGGRDRIAVYDAGMHAVAIARLRMESALRDARRLGQLRLAYQPIVEMSGGRIVACEALLRWSHPDLGEITPAQMIPIAEETGVIVDIGEWVFREACGAAARWRELAGPGAPRVTVNVSPRQLVEPGLAERFGAILAETGARPADVVIEITESALVDDLSGASARLEQLRGLGIRLALDDFGTGYSSLSYLRRFRVDTIKIDRSFVAALDEGEGSEAIIAAVLAITTGFGSSAVAEGIETAEQLGRLRDLGCVLGQGYLFARPLESADADSLIAGGGVIPIASQASCRVE